MLAEPQRPGEAGDARGVPVPLDRDGFVREVDRAVADPADVQGAAENFSRRKGQFGRVVLHAQPVVQFEQGAGPFLGPPALRHVERNAGQVQRRAVGRRFHLGADFHPAGRAARPDDPVFDDVVGRRRDAASDGRIHPGPVVRMDGLAHLGIGEGRLRVAPEILLEAPRRGQLVRPQVQLPHAEAAGLGGEAQPRLAFLLRAQPVREFRHERRVVALEPGQPLAFERHVHLAGEEVGERPGGVAHRGHQQPVPERRPVLAMVANVGLDGFNRVHGGPDARHGLRIGVRSLQEAAVAADDLGAGIAREAAEGVVREHHGIVGQAWIGDDHGHAGRPHGRDERVGASVEALQLRADPGLLGLKFLLQPAGRRRRGAVPIIQGGVP